MTKNSFTLLLSHILGVDHAGHTYTANHIEIERKLNDTEQIVLDMINKMDSDTVLLVFGDHGMTDDGNHGGGTENELKSVLFAYRKKGFPMKEMIEKNEVN
jgi:phosphatidylinositol glycan class O